MRRGLARMMPEVRDSGSEEGNRNDPVLLRTTLAKVHEELELSWGKCKAPRMVVLRFLSSAANRLGRSHPPIARACYAAIAAMNPRTSGKFQYSLPPLECWRSGVRRTMLPALVNQTFGKAALEEPPFIESVPLSIRAQKDCIACPSDVIDVKLVADVRYIWRFPAKVVE